jgi:hypothetical protein
MVSYIRKIKRGSLGLFLFLVVLSLWSCTDIEAGGSPEDIFSQHRDEVLSCSDVCEFDDWHFVNSRALLKSDVARAKNKAKLFGMEKAYYYIFFPDLYDQVYRQKIHNNQSIKLNPHKVRSKIVDVRKTERSAHKFIDITLAVQKI